MTHKDLSQVVLNYVLAISIIFMTMFFYKNSSDARKIEDNNNTGRPRVVQEDNNNTGRP